MSWKTPAIAAGGIVAAVLLAPVEAIVSIPVLAIAGVATLASGASDVMDKTVEIENAAPNFQGVADDVTETAKQISTATITTVVCASVIVGIIVLSKKS